MQQNQRFPTVLGMIFFFAGMFFMFWPLDGCRKPIQKGRACKLRRHGEELSPRLLKGKQRGKRSQSPPAAAEGERLLKGEGAGVELASTAATEHWN